jgi:acetylornithine aminotransferase
VVYEKAFHGRSIATLSATGNEKVQQGFGRWSRASSACRSTTSDALQGRRPKATRTSWPCSSKTIQGEGGINPMRMDYLQQVRQLCDDATGC